MSVLDPSRMSRGRLTGFALIAVAVIALIIGVVTLTSDDDGDNQAQPPSTPGTSAPGSEPSSPSSEPPSSEPSSTTTTPPSTSSSATVPPTSTATSTQPPATQPGGGGADGRDQPVRVYNNSKISGNAADATEDLKADGWNVVETGNYPQGIIPTTTVYYRPGTGEETAARTIGAAFGMRVEPRFDGIRDANPGVIVIVTKDYKGGSASK